MELIVTDPSMTRFMMPIRDAVNLTLKSMTLAIGGEIFVLKMPCILLEDLVDLFVDYTLSKNGHKPKVQTIGTFPGEKAYEELMTEDEIARSIEVDDMYIILPHIKEILDWYDKEILNQMGTIKTQKYNSRYTTAISKSSLETLLKEINVFQDS